MIKVLGLDISSSVVGWAIVDCSGSKPALLEHGNIKPPKSNKGSLTYRASEYYNYICSFLDEKKPDFVAIEAYANKFPRGRSTARTIIVLSFFNELTSMACLRTLGYEPEKYAVVTIRSQLSKLFGSRIVSKEDTFEYIKNNISGFVTNKNRNGKISKESYDEADAVAVALAYFNKNK
tara:strand:- start:2509 stop:3042 length:534 start_codon:yes stop_codon:yes gene_type:complete